MGETFSGRRVGLEALLRRDRTVVLLGAALLTLLSWAYLLHIAARPDGGMSMPADLAMPQMQRWGVVEVLLLFVMWAVMMVAMMVPSVAPLILIFARANRRRTGRAAVGQATVLLLGYLAVWTAFSVVATVATWQLQRTALLSPMMMGTSSLLGGAILVAAGIFQFTPLKHACLSRCRSPIGFLASEWRYGYRGTFVMGLKHGLYCVGCCWMLMALLFVAGVMNLFWVAAIGVFVLVEKVATRGELLGRIVGGALVVAGGVMIAS